MQDLESNKEIARLITVVKKKKTALIVILEYRYIKSTRAPSLKLRSDISTPDIYWKRINSGRSPDGIAHTLLLLKNCNIEVRRVQFIAQRNVISSTRKTGIPFDILGHRLMLPYLFVEMSNLSKTMEYTDLTLNNIRHLSNENVWVLNVKKLLVKPNHYRWNKVEEMPF